MLSAEELKKHDTDRYRKAYSLDPEKYRKRWLEGYRRNIEANRKRRRLYYHKNKEIELGKIFGYMKEKPEVRQKAVAKYAKRNPEKILAEKLAQKEIPLQGNCEICGDPAFLRHHPDYSKPLEVKHLCRRCHIKIHSKYPEDHTF